MSEEVSPPKRSRAIIKDEKAPSAIYKPGTELAKVMADVTKAHGDKVMRTASTAVSAFQHLPTNIFALDMALFGGVPRSLITQFYGAEGSGKTTTAMRVVASAQRMFPDEQAVVIDAEGTWSNAWAIKHGVDPSRVMLVQPDTGEQAVDICIAVLQARDTSIVVVDSIPALMPYKELERSAEDPVIGMHAKLIGLLAKKAVNALLDERKRGHQPALLLINQWRSKIVLMGDNRMLPGGKALQYCVAVGVEILNKEITGKDEHDVETIDYNEHSFRARRNKLGVGIKIGEFKMVCNPSSPLGPGFVDDGKTVITYAQKFGLFTGGGSSYKLDGVDRKFKTHAEAIEYFYEDMERYQDLKRRLISIQREHCGLRPDGWY